MRQSWTWVRTSITKLGMPALLAGILWPAERGQSQEVATPRPAESTLPTARPLWATDRFHDRSNSIGFELDRVAAAGARLAMIVANTDVSAHLDIRGHIVRLRSTRWRVPAGELEAILYLVSPEGTWAEIGRAPLKIRNRVGMDRARLLPRLDLSSTGQLDRGGDPTGSPGRRTWQDLTLRIGLEHSLAREGWAFTAQGNAVGVSEESQRLRFSERRGRAPAVDLADYRLEIGRNRSRLALGHVSAGGHRFLANSLGGRGLAASLPIGGAATLDLGLLSGTSVVGWSNLLGVTEPNHRIAAGTLGVELLPKRPGGLKLAISGLDGSLLPSTGYNEGAATDAEESRGFGIQLFASDAKQRVRFSGGLARSRFVNPSDPLLFADTTVVAVTPTTRGARFGELSIQLLQGLAITKGTEVSLGITGRHERVDPLYRTVGGSVASDLETEGLDVLGSIGALAVQASLSRARDNLGKIGSILTSHTRTRAINVNAPLGTLLGARSGSWHLPALTYSWQRVRQFGEGVPSNGDFSAGHVPDQWSTAHNASLIWAATAWTFAYRWNQSFQDNRQAGRERADFRAIVHAVSLGINGLTGLTPSLDASVERHKNFESGVTQRTERLGISTTAQLTRTTALQGSLSRAQALDPFSSQRARTTEYHLELSQGINLYRKLDSGTQSRLFVRYARSRAVLLSAAPGAAPFPAVQWTLNAGGSFRLY